MVSAPRIGCGDVSHKIDKLARELKCPVEGSPWMVDIQGHREWEEFIEAFSISSQPLRIFAEEGAEGESVSHLRIMHFHIRTKLTRFLFGIVPGETVDHVVGFRSVRHYSLPIEKIAPFDHNLRHARITT